MFVVISGTNRPNNRTIQVARLVEQEFHQLGQGVHFLDLQDLPVELYQPRSYQHKPAGFTPHQRAIDECRGIITVVPEYNGSFPGALKYFIDMLNFPGSLEEKPSAFVGIAAGQWGGVRAVDHLQSIFQYREAHLFGQRLFISKVADALDDNGKLLDPTLEARLSKLVRSFVVFARCVAPASQLGRR